MSSAARLDDLLLARGLVASREQAAALVLAGAVLVAGVKARHVGARVQSDIEISLNGPEHPFVSRGGVKLEAGLAKFGIEVRGRVCVDVGASTGGFTDCLLQRGALLVHAIDVGYGQLAWRLRTDARVLLRERVNVRHLTPRSLDPAPSLAVMDVSFISLRLVLAPTLAQLAPGGQLVALVKPQFELRRDKVGAGGVVRDEGLRQEAVRGVAEVARGLGLVVLDACDSPLPGARKGNIEILVHLSNQAAG